MPIAPLELKRITTDRLNILKHDQKWYIFTFEAALACPLINTRGAWTVLS